MTEKTACQLPLVEVHTAEESELVLEIEPFCSKDKSCEKVTTEAVSEPTSPETSAPSNSATQDHCPEKGRRNTIRQLSECSSDDRVGT